MKLWEKNLQDRAEVKHAVIVITVVFVDDDDMRKDVSFRVDHHRMKQFHENSSSVRDTSVYVPLETQDSLILYLLHQHKGVRDNHMITSLPWQPEQ